MTDPTQKREYPALLATIERQQEVMRLSEAALNTCENSDSGDNEPVQFFDDDKVDTALRAITALQGALPKEKKE